MDCNGFLIPLGPLVPTWAGTHLGPWFPLGPWAYYDYPVAYFEYPVASFEYPVAYFEYPVVYFEYPVAYSDYPVAYLLKATRAYLG